MATAITIKRNIAKLEAALKSKATPKSLKSKLETQLVKSKAELSALSKGSKPKTSSTKATQTTLQKLKSMVNKDKKYKNYKGAGVDLEKDADRPALRIGKRTAKKSGKTYYEYRANRIDVKQPSKTARYPKLEKGGYMAKGGSIPKNSKYLDIVDRFNGLKIPEKVYLNGKEYKGEVSVINGYNGYTSTPQDGLLGVFDEVSGNVWNGFKGYLKDKDGKYLRAQDRRGLTINVYADGGQVGNFRFKKGDEVYAFQFASDKNRELRKGIDPKYVVGNAKDSNLQKWAKVEIVEQWNDEKYWESYKAKLIDGHYDGFDGKIKKGEIFVVSQGQLSKSNKRPIAMNYMDEIIKGEKEDGYMAEGGKLKIGGDDFSFLLELSDNELSQRLDLVRKQQNINGQQYLTAFNKKESTQKIEESGEKLANQERAIIEARLIKYDKRHKMAKGGETLMMGDEEVYIKKSSIGLEDEVCLFYKKDDSILKCISKNQFDKFIEQGKLVPKKEKGGMMAKGGEVKFFEIVDELLDYDVQYDGDPTDTRLFSELRYSWGADNEKDYNEAQDEIESIQYKGKGWEVYASFDSSSYNYWMKQMREQNYIYITINFDSETIDVNEVEKIKNALEKATKKAEDIAYKYDYDPQNDEDDDDDEYAKGGYMAKGGVSEKEVVESNAQMVLSQIKEVKHHADELSNVVSTKSNIEAWVVAKIERASTDLSDITHYLDGQNNKMAMGGELHRNEQ